MMNRFFTTLLLILLTVGTSLAASSIKLNKTRHDFGTFQESDGDVSCTFVVQNTGDSPLLLTRVTASCGCTSPDYTKKPIRPGQKGEITVTYHAKGRPGPFEKSVYVFTNDKKNERVVLLITGNVISTTSLEETYTTVLGANLRAKITSLNFFDVYPNRKPRTRTLQLYNEGDEPIRLAFRNVPKHIDLTCEPEIIEPKREGRVLVTFLSSKVKDWGLHEDAFDLYVKGREAQMKQTRITVLADIWEDFSGLSKKEKDNAPEAEVSELAVDFGKVKAGATVTRQIKLRNTGRSKLAVRKLACTNAQAFTATADADVIKPGQEAVITITCNGDQLSKKADAHLTVMTNDPYNSRIIVNLQASR